MLHAYRGQSLELSQPNIFRPNHVHIVAGTQTVMTYKPASDIPAGRTIESGPHRLTIAPKGLLGGWVVTDEGTPITTIKWLRQHTGTITLNDGPTYTWKSKGLAAVKRKFFHEHAEVLRLDARGFRAKTSGTLILPDVDIPERDHMLLAGIAILNLLLFRQE